MKVFRFQCLILSLKTFHVIIRYGMHLYDLHHDGVWENRGIYVYYLEFMFEMTILSIDFMHHLHMLVSAMCIVIGSVYKSKAEFRMHPLIYSNMILCFRSQCVIQPRKWGALYILNKNIL